MRRGLWLIPLLALSFLVQLPLPVHAQSLDSQCNAQIANQGAGAVSLTCTLATFPSGDLVVMMGEVISSASNDCGGTNPQPNSPAGVGAWTTAICNHANSGDTQANFIYFATCTAGGGCNGDSVGYSSIVLAGGNGLAALQAYAVSGITGTGFVTSTDASAPPGPTCNPCTSLADGVSSFSQKNGATFVDSGFVTATFGTTVTTTPTTGFTQYGCQTGPSGGNAHHFCSEYLLDPTGTTTAALTYNRGSGGSSYIFGWENAVSFAFSGTPVTVTTIAACNFFQLQCWWYPLLFMGLYSGFILMVASRLNTSPRGKAHLFLSALTYGSLIAVIFGIMNIVFPLLMLILNTIIALRLRG